MHSIGSWQPALLYNLDVSVSPEEDTVWLTKEEIGLLFERDCLAISRHISNIFEEDKLSKEISCAKNAHELNGQHKGKEDYKKHTISSISAELTNEFGSGYSRRNLKAMLNFYILYKNWETVFPTLS